MEHYLVAQDDLPVCVLNDQGGSSINVEQEEISPTLRANSHQHEPVIALQANGIDRADTAGRGAMGCKVGERTKAIRLNTIDRHAVCYQSKVGAFKRAITRALVINMLVKTSWL